MSVQHRNGTAPLSQSDDSFEKRTAIHQSLIKLHSCLTHSHPDKKVVCWKDMAQGLCYPVTESNLNLWATLHVCDSSFCGAKTYPYFITAQTSREVLFDRKTSRNQGSFEWTAFKAPAAKAAQMQGHMGPSPQILAFSGLGYPPM